MAYAHDHALIATPVGFVRIEGDDDAIVSIRIDDDRAARAADACAVREAARQIAAYFAGELQAFDLPLLALTSPRGEAMRAGIVSVGYGQTLSYGGLARQLGSGSRAIGQACARNPYPIVVPCHRILAADGRLGNYSGGNGIATKRELLGHEARFSGKALPWAA